jgi:hypothetical protein
MKVTNTEILRADDRLAVAKSERARVIYQEVSKCQHLHVGEAPYQPNDWIASGPPRRACLDCGLVEDGWGPGYIILSAKSVTPISRDDALHLMTVIFCNDDKGPLIRREATVQQLLSDKLSIPEGTVNA